ncbi:MAG: helix-turn-helix domain-containing protein [Chloroflexi bacterium]|nr:helix-turn-helix domain-containing protein [Chloroflexota bacterium]
MAKPAASLPGYASVVRASEVLHLAPRSVRSLIYAGRLPSVRLGRLHYIKTSDLDLERRRRLGLPLPTPRSAKPRSGTARVEDLLSGLVDSVARPARSSRSRSAQPRASVATQEARRQRAAERAELVRHWAHRHESFEPHAPATVKHVESPITCAACTRQIRRGRYVEFIAERGQRSETLCLTCARRALMDWADRRRAEAAAARRMSQSLGQPEVQPAIQQPLLVA